MSLNTLPLPSVPHKKNKELLVKVILFQFKKNNKVQYRRSKVPA